MINIHNGEIIITTMQDINDEDEPVGFWDMNWVWKAKYHPPEIAQQIEKCELWIHVNKSGNGVILKDRHGIHYAADSEKEKPVKMHVIIVKDDDEFEHIEFMLESRAVENNYKRDDGCTWEDVVKEAENKYGKNNVRTAQVDMETSIEDDPGGYNLELYRKLHLNSLGSSNERKRAKAMTRQEIVNKLREIADEVENTKEGSITDWPDFELEKLVIVGRSGKGEPFAPVITFSKSEAKEVFLINMNI